MNEKLTEEKMDKPSRNIKSSNITKTDTQKTEKT